MLPLELRLHCLQPEKHLLQSLCRTRLLLQPAPPVAEEPAALREEEEGEDHFILESSGKAVGRFLKQFVKVKKVT